MIRALCLALLLLGGVPQSAIATGSAIKLDHANIDPNDLESLRHGAQTFANYCFNCHSVALMRYNRIATDLNLSADQVANAMIFTGAKIGDTMSVALDRDEAKRWFGVAPPDLSVIVRARGVDWLYTYLRSFYRDPARPWGVNNAVFKDVAMPHVLWELQGLQEAVYEKVTNAEGVEHEVISGFKLIEPGELSPEQFNYTVRDLVNFLTYVSEPTKTTRLHLGKWVLLFLAGYFVLMFFLKKEYWKDIK